MKSVQKVQSTQRQKRALPLIPIALGITSTVAAANIISSAATGNELWFGQSIAPLLGLSTNRGDPYTKKILLAMAKEIKTLHLSDETIIKTMENVAKEAIKFEKHNIMNMEAIAVLVMAQDLAQTVNHISQIIQMTVSKYTQILTHAAIGSTSGYAISTSEVQHLSHALYISKGLNLQTDRTQIRCKTIILNNQLALVFEILVLSKPGNTISTIQH